MCDVVEVMQLNAVLDFTVANGGDPTKARAGFYEWLNEPMDLVPRDDLRRLLGV